MRNNIISYCILVSFFLIQCVSIVCVYADGEISEEKDARQEYRDSITDDIDIIDDKDEDLFEDFYEILEEDFDALFDGTFTGEDIEEKEIKPAVLDEEVAEDVIEGETLLDFDESVGGGENK
ncbi:MAG: hypothetical protein KKH94_10130 [Candidatus Omnitrophica bacterium]|nr:hypothetical protein [Candidatus Omnitrophota bacterium]